MKQMNNKRFEVFGTSADIGITSYGKTLAHAFENAAVGMFSQITDTKKIHISEKIDIEVSAKGIDFLLISFLNELLYIFETKKIIFKKFKITYISDNLLKCTCYGCKIKPDTEIYKEIKSTTHHNLKIEKESTGWKITVLFDV